MSARQPPLRGRGALSNADSRYCAQHRQRENDGWSDRPAIDQPPATRVEVDASRSVITRNESPDIPFDRSVNPYRGCEHGCIYCYARPTHAWLGLSPGLDFETRLFYKPRAAAQLARELARPGYSCRPIALGVNTDAYQPVERRLGVTRALLEVLRDCRHPVMLITKSAAVERDLELLAAMARQNLVQVSVSITSFDPARVRALEPRAAAPHRRLQVIANLAAAGIPVGVRVAPVIPVLTDPELEAILQRCAEAGAGFAQWNLLRLPREVAALFEEWLREHHPLSADHVLERLREARGGRVNDSRFGHRMRGQGAYAELLEQRFRLACRRLGLGPEPELRCDLFRPPATDAGQLALL